MVKRTSLNIRGNYLDNSRLSGNNNFSFNDNKTNENLNMIQHIKKNIISNIIILSIYKLICLSNRTYYLIFIIDIVLSILIW